MQNHSLNALVNNDLDCSSFSFYISSIWPLFLQFSTNTALWRQQINFLYPTIKQLILYQLVIPNIRTSGTHIFDILAGVFGLNKIHTIEDYY